LARQRPAAPAFDITPVLTETHVDQAFENTSTSVAASQMRNALNNLTDSVTDENEKARFETEMDNFFALFRRYLNDKAKGNEIDWERISPPKPEQVVDYNSLGNSESVEFLSKLAVLKLNGRQRVQDHRPRRPRP
jgi:UTP--glucose-1-phosphate uridylyltransferase